MKKSSTNSENDSISEIKKIQEEFLGQENQ